MCYVCGKKLVKVKCQKCEKVFFVRRSLEHAVCECGNTVY